jgi:hypothetical protein
MQTTTDARRDRSRNRPHRRRHRRLAALVVLATVGAGPLGGVADAAEARPGPTHVFVHRGGYILSDTFRQQFQRDDLRAQPSSFKWSTEGTPVYSAFRRLVWSDWRAAPTTATGQMRTCTDGSDAPCSRWRAVTVTFGAPQRLLCDGDAPFPAVVRAYTRLKASRAGVFPADRWKLLPADQRCQRP